jgi:SAM-dependent methyltransferase
MAPKKLSGVKKYLFREQYRPSFLGLFLNPFYFGRRALFKNISQYSKYINGVTLDIGCGSKPYKDIFSSEKYIGMDIEVSGHENSRNDIDVLYDGKKIPFDNDYFDSIVCFEVLEHVFNPDQFLKEANRVLKPGGSAIFTVPFIWDEHEQPYDFARYSSFGLKSLFNNADFQIIENNKYLTDLRILVLLLNAYIYKVIKKILPSKISMMLILPIISINNILGHAFVLLPENKDLYFGNIFILKK